MKLLLFGLLLLFVVGGYAPRKNSRSLRPTARIHQEQVSSKVHQNQAYTTIETFSKKG